MQKWGYLVLTQRFRRNVSLVLFIALMLTTALFWSLSSATDAGLRDGVFTGRGAGFGGEMVVAVTVAGGSITQVDVVSHSDTPPIADPALEQLKAAVVANQSAEVDTVSGATYTSAGFRAAVAQALGKASGELADGEYVGSAEGFNGPLTVKVTVSGGTVTDVEVTAHSDTPGISDGAIKAVPEAIVAGQTADVDAVSGATYTSRGIMNAVKDAIGWE
ncbi:MAG: FMN-binding protein [Firmicutes bacterium]|nr:FMN-binding protein [Bacillota bacterium]